MDFPLGFALNPVADHERQQQEHYRAQIHF